MTIQKQLALFMAFMTLWMSFAPAVVAQETVRSAATASTGTAAPSSGDCDAAAEVGRRYAQGGAAASVVSVAWVCTQTDTATFAWKPESVGTGTSDPAKCTAGMLFVNTTTPTLKVCGPADTWTAVGSGAGSPTISTAGEGWICIMDACNTYNGFLGTTAVGTIHRVYLYPVHTKGANYTIRHSSWGVGNLSNGVAAVVCIYRSGSLVTNGQARIVGSSTSSNTPADVVFAGNVSLTAGTFYQVGFASENTSTTWSPGVTDMSLGNFNVGSQTMAGYATTGVATGTGVTYACPATTGGTSIGTAVAPTGGIAPVINLMP